MNKRIFGTILAAMLAFCMLPSTALAAPDYAYIDADGNLQTTTGTVTVLSGSGEGETLTSGWYIVQDPGVTRSSVVTVSGDVHLILADGASLDVTGGVDVTGTNSLTIYGQSSGTGALNANAQTNDFSAGIGGSYSQSCGAVTINGGNVTATGVAGAGIGGGDEGDGGTVTINGGAVTARGGDGGGAGIGGGRIGVGGVVTINGGNVTATGGAGAGIGGGYAGAGGTVTITGGTVTATGSYGAGIGGGSVGDGGTVYITGGSINATGGDGAQNIGAGTGGSGSGTLMNNAGGVNVYLTALTLDGAPAGTAVAALTSSADYGISDMFTDASGKLYLYLPEGTVTIGAQTASGAYSGCALTLSSPSSYTFVNSALAEREIELRTTETHIQWHYTDETEWHDLVALADITGATGATGATGETGATGAAGADGSDGREVELQTSGTSIQWRYKGETEWHDLVALSDITGATGAAGTDGKEVELRVSDTHIQWHYTDETEWRDLMALSDLTGETGAAGEDGKEVELRVSGTYIQWHYTDETEWRDLMALSELTGATGDTGAKGATGAKGDTGAKGATGAAGTTSKNGAEGNGIAGISKTATNGNVDTYTISFTNGTSTTFTVTNGRDGVGISGGEFNGKGELELTLTDGSTLNLGAIASISNTVPASGVFLAQGGGLLGVTPGIALAALGIALITLLSHLGFIPLPHRKQ